MKPHIQTAFGRLIDQTYGGLGGYAKPSEDWPDGIVKGATTAGQTVSLALIGDLYDGILGEGGVFSFVEEDSFSVSGNVAAPSTKSRLRGARATDGTPIFARVAGATATYDLDGTPLTFPDNGSVDVNHALLVTGDFKQQVYAVRQDITYYTIATSGVITDSGGNIVYNLFQQDMTALRVVMLLCWNIPNPPNWVNQNDSTRYPFAVLTS